MSLQFIIGRSGSGKSNLILDQVRTRLRQDPLGSPIIMLVPEQATFMIERALVQTLDIEGTIRAQVLGFRRLALRVMQETGGSALIPISEEGKKMLLYKIVRRRKDDLKLYGNSSDQLGLIERLNKLYSETKRFCADANVLEEHLRSLESEEGESPLLQDKLHDIVILFREFENELSQLYIDNEDHVVKLAEGAAASSYVHNAEIYIDGFYGFTPREYIALGELMKTAKTVTIALTLDRAYADGAVPHDLDLFHPAAVTYMKMYQLAQRLNVDIEQNIVLEQKPSPRFNDNEMLSFLESAYGTRKIWQGAKPEKEETSITLSSAGSRRVEVESAVREMRRLAQEEGARYREMALFVRNLSDYEHVVAPIMEDYGIPYFLDQKRSVLHHPLIEFVRASLDVVQKYWKYDDVFRCVKTEFLLPLDGSITRADMDRLENYVLASGIQGSRWADERAWRGAPSLSLESDETTERADAKLAMDRILNSRNAVMSPLSSLDKRLKRGKTATEMCTAVYQLLEEVDAANRLDEMAHLARNKGLPLKALEHKQLWGAVLSLLDQIVEMMGDEKLSTELFVGVLDTGLQNLTLSLVPPSLDQVVVGSTDRTRSTHVKYVFLLGINDGIIPASFQEQSVLTEQERLRLGQFGLELEPGIDRKLLDERFLIYQALSSASKSLWLSYPMADEEGKSLSPSEVIRQVRTIFPFLVEHRLGDLPSRLESNEQQLTYVSHPGPTMSRLIEQLRQWKSGNDISEVWWNVLGWYQGQAAWQPKLHLLMQSLDYRNRTRELSKSTSRKLYGTKLRSSVSRMEKFASCPFSHFASHGLKLRERQLYRLKAPDIGQLFHAALSSMAMTLKDKQISWGSLTPEQCVSEAEAAVDLLAPKLQGEILLSSKRYGYISRKLKNIVGRASVILGEQSRRGNFEPVGLELDFGPGRELPPLTFELSNGCVMEIVGRIDRVDMAEDERGILIRVIDYKSSQTDLKLHEVYYGLSLQMLTYLDVLLSSAESWLGRSALPAGTLYFHVHNPLIQSPNGMSMEQAEQEMLKRFKMKGLLLADREVIGQMDQKLEKGYSDILPVAVKADGGFYSSAAVATLDQWEILLGSVRSTIQDIGMRITEGDVNIQPYRMGQEKACTFCSYKSLCQFDERLEDNQYLTLGKPGKDQVWQMLGYDNMVDSKGEGQ